MPSEMPMIWLGGVLALVLSPLATAAQSLPSAKATAQAAPAATQCGQQPLSACTTQRVQELRRYREAMRRAVAVTSNGVMSVDEGRRVGLYDRWMTDIADKAEAISRVGDAVLQLRGAAAIEPSVQFHQEYLAFMKRLRTESPQHDTSAGLMKRKRAVLMNMLGGAQ